MTDQEFIKEVEVYFDKLGFTMEDKLTGRFKRRWNLQGDWKYFKDKGKPYELYEYTLNKIYMKRGSK